MCPGSSDPFYIVSYYIKLVTTSWTHIIIKMKFHLDDPSYEVHRVIKPFKAKKRLKGIVHLQWTRTKET